MSLSKANFCIWDGDPALWTPDEAWVALGDPPKWVPASVWKVAEEGGMLSRAAWSARFPDAPELPSKFLKALSSEGITAA
jgi:hypothetical protein